MNGGKAMPKPKSLFIGYFQSRTILYIERCMAHSLAQAKLILMRRIAKKAGVPINLVIERFKTDEHCDIKLEVEFKEVEDE